MADMWNIGGALLGGLLGNQSSTQSSTQTQSPYAAAVPYIDQTINSGMGLQSQYAAQPLSLGQIGAYATSQGLTDGFRSQAGSLTNQMNNMATFDRNNPTAKPTQFNFTDAPANYQQSMQTTINALPQASQLDLGRRIVEGGLLGGGGSTYSSSYRGADEGGTPYGGIGTGLLTDKINGQAMDTFKSLSPFSMALAGPVALYQKYQAEQEALAAANAAADPISHLNDVQGWTGGGSGSGGSGWGAGGGLSLGDSNRSAISAANGYGGGV